MNDEDCIDADENYERIPGLFRRWEFTEIIKVGRWHIEDAGSAEDGTRLYAIYKRTEILKCLSTNGY